MSAMEHISSIAVVGRETNNGRNSCYCGGTGRPTAEERWSFNFLLPNLLFCRWSEYRHWSIFQALLLLVGRPTTEEKKIVI
jgi:hypothetical protein